MLRLAVVALGALATILAGPPLYAQQSAEQLSQEAANPIADLVSLPLQNNTDYGLGEFDRARNTLNVQPVVPLAGGRLVTRTIFPIVWLPDVTAESGTRSSGLADVVFTAFYVPPSDGFMWGVGPVLDIPTGGSERGTQKWSAGPSAVILAQPLGWTLGALVQQAWSFAGESERNDVSRGLAQYFIVRQLGNGWYVNSAPIITVNWKASEGQKWVVPFGAGFGKLAFLGRLPVNAQVGAYVNAVKPDVGPDWQLRVQLQALFPVPGSS
jgi:hypothetical protein